MFSIEQAWWHYEVRRELPAAVRLATAVGARLVAHPTHVPCTFAQDHVREKPENTKLKSLTLKEFTGLIFEKVQLHPSQLCSFAPVPAPARSLFPLCCRAVF